MRALSVFSGVGGFDLGFVRAGFEVVGQVEVDGWCSRVLEERFPGVLRLGDVRGVGGGEFGAFEVLVAGYPCQPFSVIGSRRGVEDERFLWPEVVRIVEAQRPRVVVLENVVGHLRYGFAEVLGGLAALGYDAEWDCLTAASVGAPHERDRLFVVAYADGLPVSTVFGDSGEEREGALAWAEEGELFVVDEGGGASRGRCWVSEPGVGRVVDGVPYRVERLAGLGNAVVPEVARWIALRLRTVMGWM